MMQMHFNNNFVDLKNKISSGLPNSIYILLPLNNYTNLLRICNEPVIVFLVPVS